jgi:hypothetical protein
MIKYESEPPTRGLVGFESRREAAIVASLAAHARRPSDGATPTMVGIAEHPTAIGHGLPAPRLP